MLIFLSFGIDNNPVAISITQIGMVFTARKYTSLKVNTFL